MKKLMCLLYAMGIMGCGVAMPHMAPYAGTRNGVEYYMEHGTGLTLDRAVELVEVAVAGWGKSMDDVRGLKVAFYAKRIECGNMGLKDGCYFSDGRTHIIQLARGFSCPYALPIAHELWHHFWSPDKEPDQAAFAQIFAVDEIVYAHFAQLPGGCYR